MNDREMTERLIDGWSPRTFVMPDAALTSDKPGFFDGTKRKYKRLRIFSDNM